LGRGRLACLPPRRLVLSANRSKINEKTPAPFPFPDPYWRGESCRAAFWGNIPRAVENGTFVDRRLTATQRGARGRRAPRWVAVKRANANRERYTIGPGRSRPGTREDIPVSIAAYQQRLQVLAAAVVDFGIAYCWLNASRGTTRFERKLSAAMTRREAASSGSCWWTEMYRACPDCTGATPIRPCPGLWATSIDGSPCRKRS
jgi:hypothetical protein